MGSLLTRPAGTGEVEALGRPLLTRATRTRNRVIRRRVPVARVPAPVRRNRARLAEAAQPNPNYQIVNQNQAGTRAQVRAAAAATRRRLGNLDSSDEEDHVTEDTVEEPQPINPICPICQSSILNRQPVSMMCGHLFCRRCIKRSLRLRPECPICRQLLTTKCAFINVYLAQ